MEGPGLLTYAAIALLIAVVGGVTAVLGMDTRRQPGGHWLDAMRQWQGLLGSVLGFVSAAGILVLGTSLQSYQADQKAAEAAHAIGYSLALEAEGLSTELQSARDIGASYKTDSPTIGSDCAAYVATLKEILPQDTPVYHALLGNMVDFGDDNLAVFVRFYGFYENFLRTMQQTSDNECARFGEYLVGHLVGQLTNGIGIYAIVARRYGVIPPEAGPTPMPVIPDAVPAALPPKPVPSP